MKSSNNKQIVRTKVTKLKEIIKKEKRTYPFSKGYIYCERIVLLFKTRAIRLYRIKCYIENTKRKLGLKDTKEFDSIISTVNYYCSDEIIFRYDVVAEEEYLCNDFPFLTHTDPVKSFEAIEGNHIDKLWPARSF